MKVISCHDISIDKFIHPTFIITSPIFNITEFKTSEIDNKVMLTLSGDGVQIDDKDRLSIKLYCHRFRWVALGPNDYDVIDDNGELITSVSRSTETGFDREFVYYTHNLIYYRDDTRCKLQD